MPNFAADWISSLNDEQLIGEVAGLDALIDEMHRDNADPDFEGHAGSVGESLYERHALFDGELRRRGLRRSSDLLFDGDGLLKEWRLLHA